MGEYDDLVRQLRKTPGWPTLGNAAADAIEALAAENARLREALRPFAKAAEIKLCGEWRDDESIQRTDVSSAVTFGHLRAARAALAATTPTPTPVDDSARAETVIKGERE